MAEQFQEQGGASTMDPKPILRWITSRVMTHLCNPRTEEKRRRRVEKQRLRAGKGHVVEYFHQVDDGYSHLAAQMLAALAARYDISVQCHLVGGPEGRNAVEPELLLRLSRYDSTLIAPHYGLEFPPHDAPLSGNNLDLASRILAAQDNKGFIDCAAEVGHALWTNDAAGLHALAERHGLAAEEQLNAALSAGNARRRTLKHYSGAMFYYGDEWYWGVDRLYHLEKRLAVLGLDRQPDHGLLAPRPDVTTGEIKDNGSLTLELFASLRSPYTAIAFDRAVSLAQQTGVKLAVRPVLPMVMRGAPVTREKGFYIFQDTAREAREAGVPFGKIYDPIGEPVRRCYSLYPWAEEQGKGNALLSSFLRAAFAEGVNTNKEAGMRTVVDDAGLDWQTAKSRIGQAGWEELLENNRLTMYAAGLWGVPCFRLLDKNAKPLLALWGQDRLWLVAREIQKQLATPNN